MKTKAILKFKTMHRDRIGNTSVTYIQTDRPTLNLEGEDISFLQPPRNCNTFDRLQHADIIDAINEIALPDVLIFDNRKQHLVEFIDPKTGEAKKILQKFKTPKMKTLEVDIDAIQAHRKQAIEKAELQHKNAIAGAERLLKEYVAAKELQISNDKAHFKRGQEIKRGRFS